MTIHHDLVAPAIAATRERSARVKGAHGLLDRGSQVRPLPGQPSLMLANENVSYGWQATRRWRPERAIARSAKSARMHP